MNAPSGTLLPRDVAGAVLLAFAVLIAARPGVARPVHSEPVPGAPEDAVAVSPARWAPVPAVQPSLIRHDTDAAPRTVAAATLGVLSGVLALRILRRGRSAMPLLSAALQGRPPHSRSCRAPPLPRPL